MAPTIVDKTINRFGKPLLITFTSLVVISAAITIFSPGLITNPGEFCCNKAHRRRRAKSIQYPEFEGEPRDWTNEQLLEWLEAGYVYPPAGISREKLIELVESLSPQPPVHHQQQ